MTGDNQNNIESEENAFLLASTYPKAELIFKRHKSLEEVKNQCLVVIDTNALLIPYKTKQPALDEIKKVYSKLASEQRLMIPEHVAREFAKHKIEKIKNIHQALSQKRENLNQLKINNVSSVKKLESHPLLESVKGYKKILEIEEEVNKIIQNINEQISNSISKHQKEYQQSIDAVLKQIEEWNYNDPVSDIYAQIFDNSVFPDPPFDKEKLKEEMHERNQNKLPPGYKDSSKQTNSVGDLLIWKTILAIGQTYKKDVVFVSGDIKPDWWLRSYNSNLLYPRYELLHEFRCHSEGQSLHIIKLDKLLKIYEANDSVIEEVQKAEEQIYIEKIREEKIALVLQARKAVDKWLFSGNNYQKILGG